MPPFLLLGIKENSWNSGVGGEPIRFEEVCRQNRMILER
jgi:hypothetical protein